VKKVRVAMVIEFFHPLIGGAERQAHQLSQKIKTKGINVCVITRRWKGLRGFEYIDGIPVYRKFRILEFIKLPFSKFFRQKFKLSEYTYSSLFDNFHINNGSSQKKPLYYKLYQLYLCIQECCQFLVLTVLISFFFLFRGRDIDIVHCHIMARPFSIVTVWMAKRFKKKVIMKLTDSFCFEVLRRYFLHKLYLKMLRNSVDIFICINSEIREKLLELGFPADKLKSISNGIDLNRFPQADRQKMNEFKRQLSLPIKEMVCFIGSLRHKRGLDTLLEAWKELIKIKPDLLLVLIGREDNQAAYLKRMVEDNGLKESVIFTGEIKDVSPYLHASDIFILPSQSEGMSNAFLEAMATGLPIIATTVGGAKDALEHLENGLLIRYKDPQQIIESILLLTEDKELAERIGKNSRITAIEKYSLDQISDKYLELYQKLVTK